MVVDLSARMPVPFGVRSSIYRALDGLRRLLQLDGTAEIAELVADRMALRMTKKL